MRRAGTESAGRKSAVIVRNKAPEVRPVARCGGSASLRRREKSSGLRPIPERRFYRGETLRVGVVDIIELARNVHGCCCQRVNYERVDDIESAIKDTFFVM